MSRFLFIDQPAWLACCMIKVRKTSLEIPDAAGLGERFLEYCSVSIERHTPVPGVSPNGPSPFTPVVICENIELRNMASKSVAACLRLGLRLRRDFGERFGEQGIVAAVDQRRFGIRRFGLRIDDAGHHITSISAWIAPAALIACRMLDQVARADAEPIEAVDELLQRNPVFHDREFLARPR